MADAYEFGALVFSKIEMQLSVWQNDPFKNVLAKLSESEQSIVKSIIGSAISLDMKLMIPSVSDEHVVLYNKLLHSSGQSLWTLPLLEILHGG